MKDVKAPVQKTANAAKEDFLAEINEPIPAGLDIATVEPLEQLTPAQAFEMMRNAKPGELATLSSNYWKPDSANSVMLFLFTGMSTMKNEQGATVPAVLLQDEEGTNWINAASMLTSQLAKVTQLPAYVRLTYLGKKTNAKKQQYDDFKIETFHAATK